ncbi:hypothetical protein [Actinokineospora sp. NBRC 105648]|uniref:hypothetical protein n=1 Tax=Actinokineospora sp. NBRC 105648 TaxID=3032206 RepID=UPI003323F5D1
MAESLEYREIAVLIGRGPSVVSREVARHGGREGYRAVVAERAAAAGAGPAEGPGGGPGPRGACPGAQVAADRLVTGLDRGPVGV